MTRDQRMSASRLRKALKSDPFTHVHGRPRRMKADRESFSVADEDAHPAFRRG